MKSILLFENNYNDFFKSRFKYALYLKDGNFKVSVLIPVDKKNNLVPNIEGISFYYYEYDRSNKSILYFLKILFSTFEILSKNKFDIIHSFRFLPNFINCLSKLFFIKHQVIVHVTGLGIVFSNRNFKFWILQTISKIIYLFKFLLSDKLIFQNPDDISELWLPTLFKHKLNVIYGSGVDTDFYKPDNLLKSIRFNYNLKIDDIVFVCVTRLIWEKGIYELIESIKETHLHNSRIKLLIVGAPDNENPRSIPAEFINNFNSSEFIRFLGNSSNIVEILNMSDVFIYPTYYREGVPRAILEALSVGLPIITTDTPGCNLTVRNGGNGYLVKPRSVSALKNAILKIIQIPSLGEMSNLSRELCAMKFSQVVIFNKLKNIY